MVWGDEQPLLNIRAIAHHLKREPAFPHIIECGPKTIQMWMRAILPDVAAAQISRRYPEVLKLLCEIAQPPITKEQSLAYHAAHGGQNLTAPIRYLPIPTSLLNSGLPYNHGRAQRQTAKNNDLTDLSRARQLQIDSEKKKAKGERKLEKAERKKAREERKRERAERKMAKKQRKEALLALLNSSPTHTPAPTQSPVWEGFSDSEDDDQFPFKGPLAYIKSTPPNSRLKHKSASAAQQNRKRKASALLDSDKEEGPVKKKDTKGKMVVHGR
jgi:hypothetical protein